MATTEVTRDGQQAVYVYEGSLRLWHWINALAIFTLIGTGYAIGAVPMPSTTGEANDNFLFGWIRYIHFAAAYILIAGLVFRAYLVVMGNRHSRQMFLPPLLSGKWWADVLHEVKWYAFLVKEPKKYIGHNPLATLFMHFMLLWGTIFMIVTGLALYGEGTGMGSWQYEWFSSWVIPLFGQSQDVHTWHRLGMWYIICFIIIHVYAAFREDVMSRQSMISTMISGWRTFKDDRDSPADTE